MPTWAPGSDRHGAAAPGSVRVPTGHRGARGFTLLELMIVVAIIALASAVVTLALPDPAHTRLQQEAARLSTLLEAGRAQSRALGQPVRWAPGPGADAQTRAAGDGSPPDDFHFDGLPPGTDLPARWLGPAGAEAIAVQLPPQRAALLLGPEPVIGAQRLVLRLGAQQVTLATDGIGPFEVVPDAPR
jgi:general secretion pathway protein H